METLFFRALGSFCSPGSDMYIYVSPYQWLILNYGIHIYMYMYATLSVQVLNTHNLWAIFSDFFEKVSSLLISLSRSSLIMINSHIPAHRANMKGGERETE